MNTIVAASLFESPWALAVIVLVGALSQWLMKRRQANQGENQPDGGEPLPSPGKPHERSPRELDLQEALRQLLGGEPAPRAPQPPPIPDVMRGAQPAEGWPDEEQFQPEQAWMDEPQEAYEVAPAPAIQTAPLRRPQPALGLANATRIETSEPNEEAVRRFEQLNEQGRHPAIVVNIGRGGPSLAGTRAVALVRDSKTVRQAFVASLIFGPPKAFER